jgi:hypothetical protein
MSDESYFRRIEPAMQDKSIIAEILLTFQKIVEEGKEIGSDFMIDQDL